MPYILDSTRSKASVLRDPVLFHSESKPRKQTCTDIQTRLFMQVRACCLYWAAALELQGVYLIFIEETLKTQAMFNEVIILAQKSSNPSPPTQTGKHINERSPQKGLGNK